MVSSKKVTLTMQQRLDVLKDLELLPIPAVALKYNVHNMTIRRIKENAVRISTFLERKGAEKQRRRLKMPMYEELERRLLTWFKLRMKFGDIVSDALILEKAAEIKADIDSCSNFKISKGWLFNFKRRHAIQLRRINRDKNDKDIVKTENKATDESIKKDAANTANGVFSAIAKQECVDIEDTADQKHLTSNNPAMATPVKENEKCATGNELRKAGAICSDLEERNFAGEEKSKVENITNVWIKEERKDEDWIEETAQNEVENRNENAQEVSERSVNGGIKLSSQEREEVEDIFRRLESFNPRVPRSTQLLLQSMKLLYLGNKDQLSGSNIQLGHRFD